MGRNRGRPAPWRPGNVTALRSTPRAPSPAITTATSVRRSGDTVGKIDGPRGAGSISRRSPPNSAGGTPGSGDLRPPVRDGTLRSRCGAGARRAPSCAGPGHGLGLELLSGLHERALYMEPGDGAAPAGPRTRDRRPGRQPRARSPAHRAARGCGALSYREISEVLGCSTSRGRRRGRRMARTPPALLEDLVLADADWQRAGARLRGLAHAAPRGSGRWGCSSAHPPHHRPHLTTFKPPVFSSTGSRWGRWGRWGRVGPLLGVDRASGFRA